MKICKGNRRDADQYGGQETFEQYLKMYGYSLDNIKSNIETNLNIMKLLEHEITVKKMK